MESHKKTLQELQKKLAAVLEDVAQKKLSSLEAANRVVEIREQMDELIIKMKTPPYLF
jgi:hypothetical protein